MKRFPFVALAVAAVLVLLWSLFGGGEEPAPGPAVGDRREAAGRPGQGGQLEAPVTDVVSSPDAGRTARTEVDDSAPAPGDTMRTVRGRLVDSEGMPLAGLEVSVATAEHDPDRVTMPPSNARSDDEDPRMKTERDGGFALSVPGGRVGRLVMEDERWVFSGATHFEAPEGDVDLGEIPALRAGVVSGIVRDAAGRPVEDVRVAAGHGESGLLHFSSNGLNVTTTDAEGRFAVRRLRPGSIWLRTASPSFLPAEATLTLREGEERTGVELRVETGAAIAGQVLDDLGRPVAGIKVGARRTAERGNVAVERYTPDEATVTDRNGLFTLAGLEGDTAQVRAWGDGYATVMESNVPVGTGNLTLHLPRLGDVEGVVVAVDGTPISGSRVLAQSSDEDRFYGPGGDLPLLLGSVVARTDEDGRFRLEGVRPGTVTVRATGDDHRPAEQQGVTVRSGDVTSGIRLVAERGAAVEVTVLDPSGLPVEGARVRVVDPPAPTDGNSRFGRRVRVESDEDGDVSYRSGQEVTLGRGVTDAEGKATVAGLPPESVQVRAEHDDFAEAAPIAVVLPLNGSLETELTLREAGTAVVRVFSASGEPVSEARFQLHGPRVGGGGGRKWRGVTDAAGEARMASLPPGLYTAQLELQAPGRSIGGGTFTVFGEERVLPESRVEFAIAARETTDVELHRPILTTMRGEVTDAEGPVAGAVVELDPDEESGPGTGGVFNTRTGPDGSYEIADLPAGRYVMRYGRADQIVKAEETVEIPPAQPEMEKDLELRGGVLRITALSAAEAEPIEGAEVTLERADGPDGGRPQRRVLMMAVVADSSGGETMRMSLGGNSARTDVDGVAEIRDVPPGRYDVRIRHDDHATFELPDQVVVHGGVKDCGAAELAPAGILAGRVRTPDGGDVRMAMVEYWQADRPADREMRTAMNGAFRLTGLTPGRYVLRARGIPLTPGTPEAEFGPEQEIEVRAGRNPALELRTR